jgi:hypothetical protein
MRYCTLSALRSPLELAQREQNSRLGPYNGN